MSELHRHVEVLLVQVPAANTAELHTEWGNGYLSLSVIYTTLYSPVKGYGVFSFPDFTQLVAEWKNREGLREKFGILGNAYCFLQDGWEDTTCLLHLFLGQ